MPRTFLIKYHTVHKEKTIIIKAFSKYDAKQRFYRMFPKYEIVDIEVIEGESDNAED